MDTAMIEENKAPTTKDNIKKLKDLYHDYRLFAEIRERLEKDGFEIIDTGGSVRVIKEF